MQRVASWLSLILWYDVYAPFYCPFHSDIRLLVTMRIGNGDAPLHARSYTQLVMSLTRTLSTSVTACSSIQVILA